MDDHLEHLEMTVFVDDGEEFIPERMRAEKRCGSVTQVDALRHHKTLWIAFLSRKGDPRRLTLMPDRLEYSEKDDCFRLNAHSPARRWILRLSRVITCEESEEILPGDPPKTDRRTLVLQLEDQRNALQRALLHFSHLEKETKRLDETHYQITLKYDPQDETEMLIRVFSFGPFLRVTEPEDFLQLIRNRLIRQEELPRLPAEQQMSGV